ASLLITPTLSPIPPLPAELPVVPEATPKGSHVGTSARCPAAVVKDVPWTPPTVRGSLDMGRSSFITISPCKRPTPDGLRTFNFMAIVPLIDAKEEPVIWLHLFGCIRQRYSRKFLPGAFMLRVAGKLRMAKHCLLRIGSRII